MKPLFLKQKQKLNIKATNIEDGELLTTIDVDYPDHLGKPSVVDASCKKSKKFDLMCRVILMTENSAVVQAQSGKFCYETRFSEKKTNKLRIHVQKKFQDQRLG